VGAQRRPSRSLSPGGPLSASRRWPVIPIIKVVAALLWGVFLWAVSELAWSTEGPWVEVGAGALGALCALGAAALGATAWRRRRDGLRGRAAGWGIATAAMAALAGLTVVVALQSAQLSNEIYGADVQATRPVLHQLPVPSGARLQDERPGLAGTESITDDYQVSNLASVPAFYRRALPPAGWKEEPGSSDRDLLSFQKGSFEITILLDPTTSSYSVTVDRLLPTPTPS
jgi:hypothetical protein